MLPDYKTSFGHKEINLCNLTPARRIQVSTYYGADNNLVLPPKKFSVCKKKSGDVCKYVLCAVNK